MPQKKQIHKSIIEKELGIPPDYQYRALKSKFFPQANWHSNKLVIIQKLLRLNKKKRILDLGCGSGNFELKFYKSAKEIVAVDYNDEATAFLKGKIKERNISNVKVITKRIEDIETLREGKFDVIIMVDVIEHIEHTKLSKIIEGMKTRLSENGEICIVTPNYKGPWFALEWLLDRIPLFPKFGGHQHVTQFHKQNIEQLFLQHNLKMVTFKTFNLLSFLLPSKKLSAQLVKQELHIPLDLNSMLFAVFKA